GAQAPPAAAACEAFVVTVTISAHGHVAPVVSPPSFAPFQLIRRTSRPVVSLTPAGDPSIRVEHRYVLTTERTGSFTLPPFVAELSGVVARTRPLRIEVQSTPSAAVPRIIARAPIDVDRAVNFHAAATPDTVYVGEQVQYEVAVFLSEAVRERMRRSPTFFPPDIPGMLAYELPAARGEPPRRQAAGRCFDALVYQRALFPLQAGRTVIPPAQLTYALPLGPGIFSREENHELRTASVAVVALDPPENGRPDGYLGAVGNLAVESHVDSPHGRAGDPVTLTVRVAGEGNIKLLPRPRLQLPWASVVAHGERVTVDSTSTRVRGTKEFDWLVTPRVSGRVVLPPVEYPHFNPDSRRYVLARSDPLQLEVEAAPLARMDTLATVARLTLRPTYRGPLGAPLHAHPGIWVLALAAPVPAIVGAARRRRRSRQAVLVSVAQQLEVLGDDHSPREVRRRFVAALANRLRLDAGVFTRAGAVERSLRRSGVTRPLAAEAERFLRVLDAAAYGRDDRLAGADPAARTARRLYAAIDSEALERWELGPVVSGGAVLVLSVAVASGALATPAMDRAEFDRASHLYETSSFVEAAGRFERLALREPQAPDAWANFGTAAWAAADTAAAVVGWQRALRLETGATDMRLRLAALKFERAGSPGAVPSVGVTPLAAAALALWLLAWMAAAAAPARGSPLRAIAIAGTAAAIMLATFGVVVDERLKAGDLVVIRHGTSLSRSPAISARRDARVETGEVARAGGREGGWTHVRLDGERSGWIPASELVSIARAARRAD
ncbi:MAG: BatD family protein, partial [Gemmatimonadaceae bacterium]|nr:BatD family protein [Gemmatimonadaceae bacterium]